MKRTVPIEDLPRELGVDDAVAIACDRDLTFIEDRLLAGRSVLVVCDRELVPPLTGAVRARVAGRATLVVLPQLDGSDLEAGEAEDPQVVRLAFCDPGSAIPEAVTGVFGARREISGIPRECLPALVTQREARSISATEFDPFGLYLFVSGLNAVACRRVLSALAHRVEALPGRPRHREIYDEIRRATLPDEVELPAVDLDRDIGGYSEVRHQLREELVDLVQRKDHLEDCDDIHTLEALLPRGVVLHGPPGTGKTTLAKAVATALDAAVFVVSGLASEGILRHVFRRARAAAPSVVVLDPLETFATNVLLAELERLRTDEMVFVVGITRALEGVNTALLRSGRFELSIEIPAPNAEDRRAIVDVCNERMRLGLDRSLIDHLVRRTEGFADRDAGLLFSGDHLTAVCRALKRQELRTGRRGFTADDVDRTLQRRTRRPVVLSPHEERVLAVHEAGHAVLAMLVPGARPPAKITIAADVDGALAHVLRAARARPYATTVHELRAAVCVGLGGIEAERLEFEDVSLGATTDLREVAAIARAVVLGDGDRVPEHHSEQWRARIDQAVDLVLADERTRARELLQHHRALHHALVELLLEHKVLDAIRIMALAATVALPPIAPRPETV